MRFAPFLAIVFIISGCSESSHPDPIKEAIVLAVKSSLKDPDSAKITLTEPFPLFDGKIVCGTVNAKNGFGGYTGPMNFKGSINPDGTIGSVDIADSESMNAMNAESCKFLRAYGQRPGNSGSKATPAQASALTEEYTRWVNETASKIVGSTR